MRSTLVLLVLTASQTAWAEPLDPLELGRVLGSIEVCDIDIDRDIAEKWIRSRARFDFGWLETLYETKGKVEVEVKDLAPERLTIHCEQVEQIGRFFGLLP